MEPTNLSSKPILLLLWIFTIVPHVPDTNAFRWTQRLKNGTTLYHCVGDDVTFRWSYVTSPGEKVLATFLYSRDNGTLVTRFANRLMTSSKRVTFVPDVGMTLKGVRSDDAGMYGVHAKLYHSSLLYTQVVNLVVLEPPQLAGNQLEVKPVRPEDSAKPGANNNNSNSNSNSKACGRADTLRCGHLLSVGVPPVSALWTGPDQQEHFSTVVEDGHFLLELPASHKGGNYTCSLVLQPEVSKCVQNNHHLFTTSASILVETIETRMEEQGERLERLQEQLQQVRTQTSTLQRSQSAVFMEDTKSRIEHLEDHVVNFTLELDEQKASLQTFRDSALGEISQLKLSFHDALVNSEAQLKQVVQDGARTLTGRVDGVAQALSLQRADSSKQQESIQALQKQLLALGASFQGLRDLNKNLQSQLSIAQGSLDQHQALVTDLQDQVRGLREESQRQRQVNAELKNVNAERLKTIAAVQSNVSALSQRLGHAEALSAHLQMQLQKHQEDLQAQNSTAAERHAQTTESLQESAQVLKNVTNRLDTQLAEFYGECQVKILALQDQVEGVGQNVTVLALKTGSDLQAMALTITDAALRGEERVNNILDNSTRALEERLSELLQSLEQQAVRDGNDSLSLEVAALRLNVSFLHDQCDSLLPRVTSLETRTDHIDEQLSPVRLVGGSNEREGRVEVRVGKRWGTVCDDSWDNNDAKVVCNMLGFFAPGAVAKTAAFFGEGSDPIVLDDVNCNGIEQDLQMCSSRAFGTHNCQHNEDAGVICAGY